MKLRRRIHTDTDLAELAERLDIPAGELERDFLLVNIAAQLETDFPGNFCFKGGFVLRHVHGQRRLSVDIDATRHEPPQHKFDASEVASSIKRAGGNLFRIRVSEAETDSANSLDFSRVAYKGLLGSGAVAVEVSYRESLTLDPIRALIGEPFFEPFEVPVMAPNEIVAEKLRTLAQRRRPTDLSDLAFMLERVDFDSTIVKSVAAHKFKPGLVAPGDHAARIEENILAMQQGYESSITGVAPDAMPFEAASGLVLSQLRLLLP